MNDPAQEPTAAPTGWRRVRRFLHGRYLPVAYGVFLVGFFLFPNRRFLEAWFHLFVALPFLLSIPLDTLRDVARSKILLTGLALLAFLAASALWSDHELRYGRWTGLLQFLSVASFLLVTFALVRGHPKVWERILAGAVVAAGFASIVAISIYAARGGFPEARLEFYGARRHPHSGSAAPAAAALICLFAFVQGAPAKRRWPFIAILALLLATIAISRTRSAWIGLLVGVAAAAAACRDKWILAFVGVGALAAMAFALNPSQGGEDLLLRRTSGRTKMWRRSIEQFVARPWIGHGNQWPVPPAPGVSPVPLENPHNVYVSVMLYGGAVGLLLLLLVLARSFKVSAIEAWRTRNGLPFALLLFGSIFNLFGLDTVLTWPDAVWLTLWLPAGWAAAVESKEAQPPWSTK
jgi:O-antigen ligase